METISFAWVYFGAAVVLLAVLGVTQGMYESDQLTKTRTNLSSYVKYKPTMYRTVNKVAERELLYRRIRRAAYSCTASILIWSVWIVLYCIYPHTVLTLGASLVAHAALLICLGLYIRSLRRGRKFKRSYGGMMSD
jgi:hypothetical protein